MSDIKQVIVVRKDLNMRRGKESAQCCHASMKIFFDMMWKKELKGIPMVDEDGKPIEEDMTIYKLKFFTNPNPIIEWIEGSFPKVVVSCDSEEELLDLQRQAEEAGIVNALIEDNGVTEFGGVKTYTCLAIGPDYSEKIDKITGDLRLR